MKAGLALVMITCVTMCGFSHKQFRRCSNSANPSRRYRLILIILIIKVFLKRKILSIETILTARASTHTHTHTHTHTDTHTHRGTRTHKHSDCTKLNIHSLKRAANAPETWNRCTEQKTWHVYNFGKIDILRIANIALFSARFSRLTALEWGSTWVTSFNSAFFEYPPKWCTYSAGMAGATWNCSRLGANCTPYNHAPCHFMQSHIRNGVCVFSCNLPPALLAEWPGPFMCYCGDTWVNGYRNKSQHRKSTLEKKFSYRSSRDSNPRPFNHESGALTTELSPPPKEVFLD